MVNLKAKPYFLDDEGVRRVRETITSMTIEEKIGQLFINMGASRPEEYLVDVVAEELAAAGFQVTIFESGVEKLMKLPPEERERAFMGAYADKTSIASFVSRYDLFLHVANVTGTFQPVQCISFMATKATPDVPWYVHELPTIFVSVNCPFHLGDGPQVKCYINTYDGKETTPRLLVEKLLGKSEFKGVSPVDAFYGMMDTRIY